MASKVHSENGTAAETVTECDIGASDDVETERTVEARPENEVELLDDHHMVTELTPSAEMIILKNVHTSIDSKAHSKDGTDAETPEIEISPTATLEIEQRAEVKEAPEKEAKPVADHPTVMEVAKKKLPVWPGDCVFRVIVPVFKVENSIGRNGDLIKKMCEETKANIHVLEDPAWNPNRIVKISGKEDIGAPLSPAMDAVIRVFKHVIGFTEIESDGVALASIGFCSIQLLLPLMQALRLIGKKKSPIKTIQDNTGCSIRILSCDEVSTLTPNSDDRVIDIHGEALKVLEALKAVLGHLRMFLVDHTILPLSKKTAKISADPPVLNKPTSQPKGWVTPGISQTNIDQALTGPRFLGPAPIIIPEGEPMVFNFTSLVQVPPKLPQVQPATALLEIETKAEVPRELPQVQAASAVEEPVSIDEVAMQMEAEEPVIHDGMGNIDESKRSKVSWENINIVKTFLDACIHEIAINGRESDTLTLKPMSWNKVEEILKDTHNFSVDHKQMKTYFDDLKAKYIAWLSLKNKINYDPPFENEMQNNEHIKTLKNAAIPFPDLCAKLFDGAISTGILSPHDEETVIQKDTLSPSLKKKKKQINGIWSMSVFEEEKHKVVTWAEESMLHIHTLPPKRESPFSSSRRLFFGGDPPKCSPGFNPTAAPSVPQVAVKIQIPVVDVVDIIGVGGTNIGHASGAILTVDESKSSRQNITVEIRGTLSQVQTAQQLIQARTGKNRAGPAVLNKATSSQPQNQTTWGFSQTSTNQALTGPRLLGSARRRKKQPSHVAAAPLGQVSNKPLVRPSPAIGISQRVFNFTSLVQVPPELPQLQPANELMAIESETVVPAESPQVQSTSALEAIEIRAEEPVGPVSTDDVAMQMEAEEPVIHDGETVIRKDTLSSVSPSSSRLFVKNTQITGKRSMSVFEEGILGVLKMIADKMNKPEPPPKPTFEDCEKKLNELGWPTDDPLHEVAYMIFCDENDRYRELWMKLQPERCANWVRIIGRIKRLI